jgi:hypothetical protein
MQGAKKIKDHLLTTYGRGGISMLVDEGGELVDNPKSRF